MDNQDALSLLNDAESDRVERKASYSDVDKIRRTICAFANDYPNHNSPGYIFIGVNDDGGCSGISITDELLQKLASNRSDGNIHPFPKIVVQKLNLDEGECAVMKVDPSDSPPIRHKGTCYIRVGPTTREATIEEEKQLMEKRRSRNLPYDIHAVPDALLDDINNARFQEYLPNAISHESIERNNRTIDQQLTSLRFLSSLQEAIPTVLGILTLCPEPRRYIPGAYVQFLRLDGDELTDPIKNQREVDGPLLEMLLTIDEIVKTNIATAADATSGAVEIRSPDYPIVAIQQLMRNAILHRTYDGTASPVRFYWFKNHIEIHSPGGPFGIVNQQNFGQPGIADYRNPNLAEVMKNYGFVQRFGMGISLANKELKKNGNPPLEFTIETTFVQATIRGIQ